MKWWENPEVTYNGIPMGGGKTYHLREYKTAEEAIGDHLLNSVQQVVRLAKTVTWGVIEMIEGDDGIWRMSQSPHRAR